MISSNKLFTIVLLICLLMPFDLSKRGNKKKNPTYAGTVGGGGAGAGACAAGGDDDDDEDLFEVNIGKILSHGSKTKVFYSYIEKIPLYSVEKLDMERLSKNVIGSSEPKLHFDPRVPAQFQTVEKFYNYYKDLTQCQMAPAGDFEYSLEDYNGSFTYSNVFAQNAKLNCNVWNVVEDVARKLVREQGMETLYVYTGAGFDKKNYGEEGVKIIENFLGDKNSSAVPDFIFKVFYGLKDDESYIHSFIVRNVKMEMQTDALLRHATTLDRIEMLVGCEFPEKLKDAKNKVLCQHFECRLPDGSEYEISGASDHSRDAVDYFNEVTSDM